MSEVLGSNASPESTLRFSVDDLYAAGVRLGPVESTMQPPTTTFEELHRRAEDLLRRIDGRKARRIALFRGCALAIAICGAAAFLGSFILAKE